MLIARMIPGQGLHPGRVSLLALANNVRALCIRVLMLVLPHRFGAYMRG